MKDIILTPALSRAARALLGWQQKDLARQAGLSLTALKAFEQGGEKTRPQTMAALQNALEAGGIEFLSGGGLRPVEEVSTITRLTGPRFIANFYDDIYTACASSRADILTSSTDQRMWWHPSILAQQQAFEAWVRRLSIPMRSIIAKGDRVMANFPTVHYRAVPKEMLGKITYALYADRLAFLLWKKKQVLILRNAAIVETFRAQFDYLWRQGQSVSHKIIS